jgi:hypothetical protein
VAKLDARIKAQEDKVEKALAHALAYEPDGLSITLESEDRIASAYDAVHELAKLERERERRDD